MEIRIPDTPEREPPASAVPARLVEAQRDSEGESKGERKRKMTEAYGEARQAGLQSLGYLQVEK
jgi:hypothetical protein